MEEPTMADTPDPIRAIVERRLAQVSRSAGHQ